MFHDSRVNIAYLLNHSDLILQLETRSKPVPISFLPGVYHGKDRDYQDPAVMINERKSCPPSWTVGEKKRI